MKNAVRILQNNKVETWLKRWYNDIAYIMVKITEG